MSLSRNKAFFLQASIVVSFLAGSSAPTPLYAVYQAAWGFSPITTTVVFGVYALAVLAALLVLGSLSDYVGRRPVLFGAALLQAATMLVFATAHGVASLLVARVIQGLATGAAVSAVGAGMIDIDRARGATANAVGPMLGSATGGLVSGLFVQYLPAPTVLVYAVLGVVFVAQAFGVLAMTETSARRSGALASLRPHVALPAALARPMLLAAPAIVGTWALVGFYASLGPTLLRELVVGGSRLLGGLALFTLAGTGALAVFSLRAFSPQNLMKIGTATLIAGVGLTLASVAAHSVPAFFLGTALSGAGFGPAFQGAVRSVIPLAAAHERAGALSVLYVVAYLAMGLPAVLAGVGVVFGGGVVRTADAYGAAVMLLSALALAGSVFARASSALARPVDAIPSRP
ncbi:MAG TPA: MFS transporter [Polyangiaceae bacterium]|nr:MFS transporter [Polyangiaceae bacterium]